MQIEAFNFTGNETNRTITLNEISGAVHLSIVDDDTGKYPHYRITGMSNSQRIGHTATSTTAITALGSGSIDLGTSTDVNATGNAITGFAVRDDGNDDFKVGSYTGDGGATKSIATGLSDLENVWVFEDASTAAYWHSKSMGATTDASYPFVNGVSASGYITDIGTTAGTFIVGSALNTSAKTYYYVAWGSVSGFIDSIGFSGNSTDNRNLDVDPNNGGNTPELGHIGNDTTARNGNWRVEENSRGHSGDSCSQWTAATTQTNRLQGFSSETIQLGTNTDVNATGNSYDIFWAINNPAGVTVAPPTATLGLTGFAPTVLVSDNKIVSVPVANINPTGLVPVVVASDHKTVPVPVASLTASGLIPTIAVTENQFVDVPVATINPTGFSPSIVTTNDQFVDVPAASLALVGFAPTVTITGNVFINVPAGVLPLNGFAPTISVSGNQVISPPTAVLGLDGLVPSISASDHKVVQVPSATLILTGYVPNVGNPVTIEIPVGAITLNGYAPSIDVTQHVYIEVPVSSLTLDGFVPTVGADQSVEIPVASLTLTGHAPTIIAIEITTPDGRIIIIEAENRVSSIENENRVYSIDE